MRFKQIGREINNIGLGRFVFVAVLGFFLLFALYVKSSDRIISQYVCVGFLLTLILIHVRRNDKEFLKTNFSNAKAIMLSEYIILSVPFIICFLVHKQWIVVGEILLGLLLVVNIDFKPVKPNLNTKLQKLIPDDAFEWKAGIRKYFYIIIAVWILSAVTSFFVGSVPIAMFIFGIFSFSFLESCEPYQMLFSYQLTSKKFLALKIKRQLQIFSFTVIPLVILFLIFNFDKWYIIVAEYVILCSLIVYTVVVKYSFYEPNTRLPAAQIFVMVGVFGGIIPILLPIVWLLTIWFYLKSIKKLKPLLDDYN